MSSFVGLLHFDGAPCQPQIIEAMLARLSHRVTPDGARRQSARCAGAVGLGCAVLPTTPQARLELENPDAHQTLREGEAQLWICSDARLDNRAEVVGALNAQSESENWSDGRVILAAYARWGEECAARLRGDFAGAIWDARRQSLFCLRDSFGVKPFYYLHAPGRFLAFASEIKALWQVPGADPAPDPAQIADYLGGRFPNKTDSFFLHVRRLAPASWMSVALAAGEESPQQNQYWRLDESEELGAPGDDRARDEKYAELVGAAFGESLEERMKCDGRLSSFLSGGLDSSSIAACAERRSPEADKPLLTLSTVFDHFPKVDEREFIGQTLARGEFEPLWLMGDEISPLEPLERIVWHLDAPSPGPNIASTWYQYQMLKQHGIHVVLDGHGGDEIIFRGYERVDELLIDGHFRTAWHEIRLLHRQGAIVQGPVTQMWSAFLWHARDKRGLGRLTRGIRARRARRALSADTTRKLDDLSLRVMTPACRDLMHPETPRPSSFRTRFHHAHEIDGPLQVMALENIDALSGAHAIETRCPFWERELAQLCVQLPADQKLRHGYNRYVMRRAMEGVLAPGVQWRRSKTDFSPQFMTAMQTGENARLTHFFDSWRETTPQLADYVDMEELRAVWGEFQKAAPNSRELARCAIVLWKIYSLALWLAGAPQRAASANAQ